MDAAGGGGLGDDAALDALRDALATLGATAPRLVFRNTLTSSDVNPNQARLLISCRPGRRRRPRRGEEDGDGGIVDGTALTAFLTSDEKDSCGVSYDWNAQTKVRAYEPYPRIPRGMQVPAYDRHGRRFDMMLKMSQASSAYRLSGDWLRFLRDNQVAETTAAEKEMGRKLKVELLAFRSLELPPLETGQQHPDGALGMAILIRN